MVTSSWKFPGTWVTLEFSKLTPFLTSITTVYVWVWFLGGPRLLWDSPVPVSWSRCSVLLPRSFCWGLDTIQVQASCDHKGVWRYLDTRIRIRSTESGRNEGCIQSQDQMSTEWIWFVCYFCLFLYPLCYIVQCSTLRYMYKNTCIMIMICYNQLFNRCDIPGA